MQVQWRSRCRRAAAAALRTYQAVALACGCCRCGCCRHVANGCCCGAPSNTCCSQGRKARLNACCLKFEGARTPTAVDLQAAKQGVMPGNNLPTLPTWQRPDRLTCYSCSCCCRSCRRAACCLAALSGQQCQHLGCLALHRGRCRLGLLLLLRLLALLLMLLLLMRPLSLGCRTSGWSSRRAAWQREQGRLGQCRRVGGGSASGRACKAASS